MQAKEKLPEIEVESVESVVTPMMQQYLAIKKEYSDYLLFYRMGDFFELFYDDAIAASKALDIVLTRRGKAQGADIPMCGVPAHSNEAYLHKLIKLGFKVAICDQVETPEEAKAKRGYKAVVNREVIRVVTPGTLTEDNLLENNASNFLLAVNGRKDGKLALCWCDISTGEVYFSNILRDAIFSEIERIAPKEIIVNDEVLSEKFSEEFFRVYRKIITSYPKNFFESSKAERKICDGYKIKSLDSFEKMDKEELGSLSALIEYLQMTQVGKMPRLSAPKRNNEKDFLEIDQASFKNLEIFGAAGGEDGASLFSILNRTHTNAGTRLMRKILARPLVDKKAIESRLDCVEFFKNNEEGRTQITGILKSIPDFERIISRIYLNRSNPRDIAALRDGLKSVLKLQEVFSFSNFAKIPAELQKHVNKIHNFDTLINTLDNALMEFPAIAINEGGYIKPGHNAKLDDYRNIRQSSEKIKTSLQEKYIKESGITTLKIKDNNVIGMFIETTAMHIDKIPTYFVHRQTLANNIRFTTDELKKIENEIINAKSYAINLEMEIFRELQNEILNSAERIIETSESISFLDLFSGFAELASEQNYCRAEITDKIEFLVEEGRHPIVESAIKNSKEKQSFIGNDLNLTQDGFVWLLTGPNMSGKSTFLRQNALIAIMAHIGCFVPAKSAKIGIIDKIFSRVGASDNIAKGHSTFMVEMIETAAILNNSTARSFLILDEVGRGTATFDGLAIAWAALEHIHDNLRARCLFATHYHELHELDVELKGLSCHTTDIKEWNGDIVFMHRIIPGKASQSYGIHVAKIAGIPQSVIERANDIMTTLVRQNKGASVDILAAALPLFAEENKNSILNNKLDNAGKAALDRLNSVDINNITPVEAFKLLVEIKGGLTTKG